MGVQAFSSRTSNILRFSLIPAGQVTARTFDLGTLQHPRMSSVYRKETSLPLEDWEDESPEARMGPAPSRCFLSGRKAERQRGDLLEGEEGDQSPPTVISVVGTEPCVAGAFHAAQETRSRCTGDQHHDPMRQGEEAAESPRTSTLGSLPGTGPVLRWLRNRTAFK